jgi:RNA recognition motif-containing protein
MKIYVGNLAYDINEEELRQQFLPFGKVDSVSVITDKATGRSKGFAFVEMSTVSEGQAAMTALNGKVIKDRALTVNAAKAREERGGGGGGFGGGSRNRY